MGGSDDDGKRRSVSGRGATVERSQAYIHGQDARTLHSMHAAATRFGNLSARADTELGWMPTMAVDGQCGAGKACLRQKTAPINARRLVLSAVKEKSPADKLARRTRFAETVRGSTSAPRMPRTSTPCDPCLCTGGCWLLHLGTHGCIGLAKPRDRHSRARCAVRDVRCV